MSGWSGPEFLVLGGLLVVAVVVVIEVTGGPSTPERDPAVVSAEVCAEKAKSVHQADSPVGDPTITATGGNHYRVAGAVRMVEGAPTKQLRYTCDVAFNPDDRTWQITRMELSPG